MSPVVPPLRGVDGAAAFRRRDGEWKRRGEGAFRGTALPSSSSPLRLGSKAVGCVRSSTVRPYSVSSYLWPLKPFLAHQKPREHRPRTASKGEAAKAQPSLILRAYTASPRLQRALLLLPHSSLRCRGRSLALGVEAASPSFKPNPLFSPRPLCSSLHSRPVALFSFRCFLACRRPPPLSPARAPALPRPSLSTRRAAPSCAPWAPSARRSTPGPTPCSPRRPSTPRPSTPTPF